MSITTYKGKKMNKELLQPNKGIYTTNVVGVPVSVVMINIIDT